jgi:hypothetical protein
MKKPDRKLITLRGRVEHALVKRGTASEHHGVVLHTPEGERVRLQRVGGNPFDDAETRRLVGHRVCVEGYRLDDLMRFVRSTVED